MALGYQCSPENINCPPNASFFIWGLCGLFFGDYGHVFLFTPYITWAKTDTKVSSLLLSINLF